MRVQGLGLRVQGLGFRVQGLGFGVGSLGFRFPEAEERDSKASERRTSCASIARMCRSTCGGVSVSYERGTPVRWQISRGLGDSQGGWIVPAHRGRGEGSTQGPSYPQSKVHFGRFRQLLAINAHEMAPRTRRWLQERGRDTHTKGLLWG